MYMNLLGCWEWEGNRLKVRSLQLPIYFLFASVLIFLQGSGTENDYRCACFLVEFLSAHLACCQAVSPKVSILSSLYLSTSELFLKGQVSQHHRKHS